MLFDQTTEGAEANTESAEASTESAETTSAEPSKNVDEDKNVKSISILFLCDI